VWLSDPEAWRPLPHWGLETVPGKGKRGSISCFLEEFESDGAKQGNGSKKKNIAMHAKEVSENRILEGRNRCAGKGSSSRNPVGARKFSISCLQRGSYLKRGSEIHLKLQNAARGGLYHSPMGASSIEEFASTAPRKSPESTGKEFSFFQLRNRVWRIVPRKGQTGRAQCPFPSC